MQTKILAIIRGVLWVCSLMSHSPLLQAQDIPFPSGVSVSPYPITIQQADGSRLTIIGQGNQYISYTETVDGYTLIKNSQKIYEYAIQATDGSLTTSGIKAKNLEERTKKEIRQLKAIPKHLRYQPPYLDSLKQQINNN